MGNGDRCGNTAGMETGVAVIPLGWNMFIQEPEILPTIKIPMHVF